MSGDHNQYQKNLSYLDFECPRCGHCCYVDADDTSQKRVDEKAKREHEWVGLTDEEIYDCEEEVEMPQYEISSADLYAFASVIETKLREKNT